MLVAQPPAHRVAAVVVVDDDRHHVAGGALDAGVVVGNEQVGQTGQLGAVGPGQRAPALDLGLEPGEARVQQRRARLVEPVVVAEPDDVVGGGLARLAAPRPGGHRLRAQGAGERRDSVVVRRQQPALAAGEDLVREERERAGEAPRPELAALEVGARRVRGVLDQGEPVRVAERAQALHRRWVAREVHRADRLRARADAPFDVFGVEPEVVRPEDVGEDRRAAAVDDRGRRRREGHRRDDHLVPGPDAGGEVGEVQRGGTRRDRDGVTDAEVEGEGVLELARPRSKRQPARLERLHDRRDVLRLEAEVVERDEARRCSGIGHRTRPRSASPRARR